MTKDSDQARGDRAIPALPPLPWRDPSHPRRRRASGPALDRERIVEAGLRIVDDEGVDALSLRRLAADLGVTPMAVYWHVRDKAELLDRIGERLYDTIEVPPRDGPWPDQLRDVHLAMLTPLHEHPNAVELMLGRARYCPAGIALFERILSILRSAGLPPVEAFDAYQALYQFVLGFITTARRSPEFREGQRQGVLYLRSLGSTQFPSVAEVAPVIGTRSVTEQFELGLGLVLSGIAAGLRMQAPAPGDAGSSEHAAAE